MALSKKVKKEEAPVETPEVKTPVVETPEVEQTVPVVAEEKAVSTDIASVFINNPAMVDAAQNATYGVFTSVTANNGTHTAGEEDLGKEIDFQAIIQKEILKLIPGSNDEEATEFFCTSTDGTYSDRDGILMVDLVEECKDAGYPKAKLTKYIDIVSRVVSCENSDFVGEIVTLQLAPSSQYTWNPLAGKLKMQAAMGNLKATPINPDNPSLGSAVVFHSIATPTKYKGNNFTKFIFSIK